MAALPTSRAVSVSQSATFFATVLNPGTVPLTACTPNLIAGGTADGLAFSFDRTEPTTNVPLGLTDQPFDVGPGEAVTLVGTLGSETPIEDPMTLPFDLECAEAAVPAVFAGVNTVTFRAREAEGPDIIALPALAEPDKILRVPIDGGAAMGAAIFNLGAPGTVGVRPTTAYSLAPAPGAEQIPLTLSICQLDEFGACLSTPAGAVQLTLGADEPAAFGIFAAGQGQPVALDIIKHRIFLEVLDQDHVLLGATSAAVMTVE
jgi:hypothetical protein